MHIFPLQALVKTDLCNNTMHMMHLVTWDCDSKVNSSAGHHRLQSLSSNKAPRCTHRLVHQVLCIGQRDTCMAVLCITMSHDCTMCFCVRRATLRDKTRNPAPGIQGMATVKDTAAAAELGALEAVAGS